MIPIIKKDGKYQEKEIAIGKLVLTKNFHYVGLNL